MSGSEPRVVVYGRPGCHLCEDAVAVVERVCAELGEQWVEVDITTDPELEDRFRDEVPVTFVDGRQHDFWRVDPERLGQALQASDGPRRQRRGGSWNPFRSRDG